MFENTRGGPFPKFSGDYPLGRHVRGVQILGSSGSCRQVNSCTQAGFSPNPGITYLRAIKGAGHRCRWVVDMLKLGGFPFPRQSQAITPGIRNKDEPSPRAMMTLAMQSQFLGGLERLSRTPGESYDAKEALGWKRDRPLAPCTMHHAPRIQQTAR